MGLNVVIYGKDQCPKCTSLKQLLDNRGIPYTYLTLNVDYGTKDLMEIKPLDVKSFPVSFIVCNDESIYIENSEIVDTYFNEEKWTRYTNDTK